MTVQAKREKNILTLPDSIVNELGDTEYFDIVTEAERIVLTPAPAKPKKKNGVASLCGILKGKVWMVDDFNAPMELVQARKSIQERFKGFTGKYEAETIDWGQPAGEEVW